MNTKNVILRHRGAPGIRSLLHASLAVIALILLFHGQAALAAESASFQLYDSFPNVSDPGPDQSNSFLLNENGVTWVAQPIASTSFQIVTAPPVSSSSASSVGSSVSSVSSSSTPATGGHRGAGTTTTASPAHKTSGGKIPSLRPSAPARGSALPKESQLPGKGVVPSTRGVPPHHYRQPVEIFRSSAPLRETIRQWSHYRQRFLNTLSASLLDEANAGTAWTFSIGLLCVLIQLLVLVFIELRHSRTRRNAPRKRLKRPTIRRWLFIFCVIAGTALVTSSRSVLAASGPQTFVYNGHLLNASGNAITTAHTVRFSLWTSADYVTGDVTATGAIHTSAATYAGWKEAYTVTPNANGYFSVRLGSGTALPDFSTFSASALASLHLQVEVKADGDPATSYEVLDQDAGNTAVDRAPLLAVPFALNADFLDQRHVGTGSGSIPVLASGGLLDLSQAPGGTQRNTFTIDADNSVSSGNISLEFGDSLGKTLSYDVSNGQFDFNDDLKVQGNLTVTGLINGVDITQITSSTDNSHLKVASGAGLTITVARGDYRLGGVVTQYGGTNAQAVTNDATNYVFFSSGGLTVNTTGFPTNSAVIPVATVLAAGGAVTGVTDRRVFNNNDTQRTIVKVYEPLYEGATYQGDGSNNVGQLTVGHSGSVLRNYYNWSSTRSTLQDYGVLLRVPVSSDFTRWGAAPLSLIYRTTSSSALNSALAVQVYDTAGAAVTLTGSGAASLVSTDWTTATWGFAGTPTWTPGGEMLIKLTFSAKDSSSVWAGPLTVRFAEMLSE